MKKGEKAVIFILVVITVILIIIGAVTKNNKNNSNGTVDSQVSEEKSNIDILEDGTKLNVSSALNSKKNIEDGLEVTDIQLTEKDNMTLLLGTIKNTSSETKGGYLIDISFLSEDGSVIATIGGIVPELAPGETTPLETSTTLDYSEAYDLSISKK